MLESPACASERAESLRPVERPSSHLELDRNFQFILWIWNAPTNGNPSPDFARVGHLLDKLVGAGIRLTFVTRTNTSSLSSLIDQVPPAHRKRVFVIDDGATVTGFDHRGMPIELSRHAFSNRTDAVKHVLDHEIIPLGIVPTNMLVMGGAFGTTNDSENDVLAALRLPQCRGAAVSLGSGLEHIEETLQKQVSIDEKRGAFALPRDAAWAIVESGFDVAREHEIESLLAIANGYVGVRGSIAEGSDVSRPATFLAGAFEPSSDVYPVPEIVIAPDWGRLRFTIEGEPFTAWGTTMHEHHRTLDMRRGILLREVLGTCSGGHTTEIRTMHVASMARRHMLLEGVTIVPKNFSGSVVIDAILSGDVKSESGATHWANFEPRSVQSGPMLLGTTRGGMHVALASVATAADPDTIELRCSGEIGSAWAMERCELHVRIGKPSALHRVVGLYTSRDDGDPTACAEALANEVAASPFATLLSDHEASWKVRWARANVEIDGAPTIERALRFALYHLLSAVHPDDSRTSVGARALSGEAYRGHIFWDTEIFMLPFYVYAWPEAAKTLLRYRHRTLNGARRKAKRLGYSGALYAWESADTGDETTPELVVNPFGEIVPILSGLEEHHISADVAYAVRAYVSATGDVDFLREEGTDILVETARFWASRVTPKKDGKFHIERVIGPDEYHESVDDNAFTNWMAQKNLRVAAAVARAEGQTRALSLGVEPTEIAMWEDVATRMYLGLDDITHLIEQQQGFYQLEHIDLGAYSPRTAPIDVLLGRSRTQASQVVKQADVVQLVALLWDELDPRVRRENFLYYEPRTAHGSSLSPGIHALVAARLGLHDLAARYLEQTAAIDLGNTMGNAAGGVHAAAMGSLWQAVVFGVAGVRVDSEEPDSVYVEPNLLPGMRRVSLPFTIGGRTIDVHVCRNTIEVRVVDGPAPLGLAVAGPGGTRRRVRAEPGRAYVTRRDRDGFSAWEETSG